MPITPEQFAELLKQSMLDDADQRAVLDMLPHLTLFQIEKLGKILEDDVRSQEKIFSDAKAQSDTLLLKMKVEMEKLRKQKH